MVIDASVPPPAISGASVDNSTSWVVSPFQSFRCRSACLSLSNTRICASFASRDAPSTDVTDSPAGGRRIISNGCVVPLTNGNDSRDAPVLFGPGVLLLAAPFPSIRRLFRLPHETFCHVDVFCAEPCPPVTLPFVAPSDVVAMSTQVALGDAPPTLVIWVAQPPLAVGIITVPPSL